MLFENFEVVLFLGLYFRKYGNNFLEKSSDYFVYFNSQFNNFNICLVFEVFEFLIFNVESESF